MSTYSHQPSTAADTGATANPIQDSKRAEPMTARPVTGFDKRKLVIGLTGGIGSGKSAATDWFADQGIDIIDADVIAHEVVAKGTPTLRHIQKKFGDWVINAAGEMDRAAVRAHVFANPEALIALETITHPAIREAAKVQLNASTSAYAVLSAPLLIEGAAAGLANLCQRILVIDTTEEIQLARASRRDGQSIAKIKAIMLNQLDRTERTNYADDVVLNDADLATLYARLEPLHQDYLMLAQQLKFAVD